MNYRSYLLFMSMSTMSVLVPGDNPSLSCGKAGFPVQVVSFAPPLFFNLIASAQKQMRGERASRVYNLTLQWRNLLQCTGTHTCVAGSCTPRSFKLKSLTLTSPAKAILGSLGVATALMGAGYWYTKLRSTSNGESKKVS